MRLLQNDCSLLFLFFSVLFYGTGYSTRTGNSIHVHRIGLCTVGGTNTSWTECMDDLIRRIPSSFIGFFYQPSSTADLTLACPVLSAYPQGSQSYMGRTGPASFGHTMQGFVERAQEVDGGKAKQYGNMVVATTLTKRKGKKKREKKKKVSN
jgi:hypothetical protein